MHLRMYSHKRSAVKESLEDNARQSLNTMPSEGVRNSLSIDIAPSIIFRISDTSSYSPNFIERHARSRHQSKIKQQKTINTQKITAIGKELAILAEKLEVAKGQLKKSRNLPPKEEMEQEQSVVELQTLSDSSIHFKNQNTFIFCKNMHSRLPSHLKNSDNLAANRKYYIKDLVNNGVNQSHKIKEHLRTSFRLIKACHSLKLPAFEEIQKRMQPAPLASDQHKKVLLLDLDQTLIHCSDKQNSPNDIQVQMSVFDGQPIKTHFISIRPYALTFLKRISQTYQIIIFTASTNSYADVILDEIDPDRTLIKCRLYRQSCIKLKDSLYVKDLRILNRDLKDVVLVDNAPGSYIFQLSNAIPIISYYKGEDYELIHLQRYLQQLVRCEDVRQINRRTFKLDRYHQFKTIDQLISTLYISH